MKSVNPPSSVVVPPVAICPRCGAPIGGFGPEGLCGACLFDSGLAVEDPAVELSLVESASRRFRDYELLEEIARGGMGVIFKARQLSLNRMVALKMILRGEYASVAELARFRAEAEMAARLQHPNIVTIHEVGECEGQPFFSMDYVEGQNLAQLIGNTPLPAARAAKYLRTIAEAVQYAHEQGILHRDLKPSNVLIDAGDQPHVTDFGLAKRFATQTANAESLDLTLTGQVLGSPNFMPPEQAAGRHDAIGPAGDVYSLGAILYHILTGRPPFIAEGIPATLRLVAEVEPVPPSLLVPTVPRDMETICLKCLEKEPQRRYTSAKELVKDLNRFLLDEPIHARPASQLERIWRWCRRNRALAATAAAVVLLLLTIAIGSSLTAAHLQAANREGQENLRESLIAQARAGRWGGRMGKRFAGLEALNKAVAIRPSIELRNEAIACLALFDLRPVKSLGVFADHSPCFDPPFARYAMDDDRGNVVIHRVSDDAQLTCISNNFPSAGYGPWFSPQGRYLAISRKDGKDRSFKIWDFIRNDFIFTTNVASVFDVDFSKDERLVIITQGGSNNLLRVSLPSGEIRDLGHPEISAETGRVNPAGNLLAVSTTLSPKIDVLNTETGQVLFSLAQSSAVYSLRWHPEGRLLACACRDGTICLWDTTTHSLCRTIEAHRSAAISVSFSNDGQILSSGGWDGTARFWNVWTGRQILTLPSGSYVGAFSSDDRFISLSEYSSTRLYKIAGTDAWRGFHVVEGSAGVGGGCAWSQNGEVLITTHRDGSRLWNTQTGREIALLPSKVGEPWFATFDAAGSNILATTGAGVACWRVQWTQLERESKIVLGPEEIIGPQLTSGGGLIFNRLGNLLVAEIGGSIKVFEWPGKRLLQTLSIKEGVFGLAISRSGKYCVAWPRSGTFSRSVWDLTQGVVVAFPSMTDFYAAAFTSNDRLLIAGNGNEYQAWDTQSWKTMWKIVRPKSLQAGRITLSDSGKMGACTFAEDTIRLFNPDNGEELATLEAPEQEIIMGLAFSPDGTRLAATTGANLIHMWDLRLIRQELAAMNLDWEGPTFPPSTPFAKRKLSVTILTEAASH